MDNDDDFMQAMEFANKIENLMLKDKGEAEDLYRNYEYFLKVAYQGMMRVLYFYPGNLKGPEILFYIFYAGYMAGKGYGIEDLVDDLDMDVWGDFFEEE